MKRFLFPLLLMFACNRQPDKASVRVAGMKKEAQTVPAGADSLLFYEQDKHNLWITQTFYGLKHKGYSTKNAWLYIDSASRAMYKGILPPWYEKMKRETDSLIKEKNKYKRVRIV